MRGVRRVVLIGGLAASVLLGCSVVLGIEVKELVPDGDAADPTATGHRGEAGDGAVAGDAAVPDGGCSPDLSSDGANCGRCGHACGGATCTKGVCDPIAIVTGATNPWSIAVDDTYVYFTNESEQGGDLQRIDKTAPPGSAPSQVFASNTIIRWIVTAQGRIFWADQGATVSSSLPDGSNKKDYPSVGTPTGVAVAGNDVYWIDMRDGADQGSIVTCPLQPGGGCGAAVVIAGTQTNAWGLTTDGTSIAWTRDPSTLASSVYGCAKPFPCTATAFAPAQKQSSAVLVAKSRLFWLEEGDGYLDYTTGRIHVCDLPGCTGANAFATSQARPAWLFADDTHLFWVNSSQSGTNEGSIFMCTLPACTDAVPFVERQAQPIQAVSDGQFVYWTMPYAGIIMKRAKP